MAIPLDETQFFASYAGPESDKAGHCCPAL